MLISSAYSGRTCVFETWVETGSNTSTVCWILAIFRDPAQKKKHIGKKEKENDPLTFL